MTAKAPDPDSRPSAASSTGSTPTYPGGSPPALPTGPGPSGSAPATGSTPAVSPPPAATPPATTPPATATSPATAPVPAPAPAPANGTTKPAPRPVVNAALKKSKRPPQERTGGGNGAVIAATLAILVAAGAVLVALYALNVARDAKSNAASASSYASRIASPPKAVAPTTAAASPGATAPAPTPSPTPALIPDLRAADLTIPPTVGCASLFVDVDSGQVGNFAGHDFYFTACLGNLSVVFDNVDAAAASGGSTTVEACLAALAKAPASPNEQLPVTSGMTFCLFTSKETAARTGMPQRLAVAQIRQIAPDRTITLTLDTYKLPSS